MTTVKGLFDKFFCSFLSLISSHFYCLSSSFYLAEAGWAVADVHYSALIDTRLEEYHLIRWSRIFRFHLLFVIFLSLFVLEDCCPLRTTLGVLPLLLLQLN
jgi:hypothetical protein